MEPVELEQPSSSLEDIASLTDNSHLPPGKSTSSWFLEPLEQEHTVVAFEYIHPEIVAG